MSPTPVVALERVSRRYPGSPPVDAVREIDLTVQRGEFVAVVGRSGSGKSTLLNLLGLLDRPTAGRYLLDGIDTGCLRERERARVRGERIGVVFQAFHLVAHATVEENVMMSGLYTGVPARQRRRNARRLLERVGLGDRWAEHPGLLSGGERQRVAIARALAGAPSLLLADEPTGNLDSVTATTVLDLFAGAHAAGATILMITHDPAVAARAERTIRIDDGRVGRR